MRTVAMFMVLTEQTFFNVNAPNVRLVKMVLLFKHITSNHNGPPALDSLRSRVLWALGL